jgi:cation:H+ antiporter
MQDSITLWVLLFALATYAIWRAGSVLVDATDAIDDRWNLGAALGGAILLAVATNLPEIAIVFSAASKGNTDVIVGNLLGGVAIQTTLLALFDCRLQGQLPLTQRASSLVLVLEGLLVVAVLYICIMGTQLPATLIFEGITPGPFLITLIWLAGLWLIGWVNRNRATAPEGAVPTGKPTGSLAKVYWVFVMASLVTLVAGVILEWSGEKIAAQLHIDGVLFGATVLAAATSLPEISTGLRAVRKGDYQLAVSDIFGGNLFLPVLFLPATLISGRAILPLAQKSDIYIAALAGFLTCLYLIGLLVRPEKKLFRLGLDSLAVLLFYVVGMTVLLATA